MTQKAYYLAKYLFKCGKAECHSNPVLRKYTSPGPKKVHTCIYYY